MSKRICPGCRSLDGEHKFDDTCTLVPQPKRDARGVPYCAEDECAQYDGKRCMLIGFRPGNICEPAVVEMAEQLASLATPSAREGGERG